MVVSSKAIGVQNYMKSGNFNLSKGPGKNPRPAKQSINTVKAVPPPKSNIKPTSNPKSKSINPIFKRVK